MYLFMCFFNTICRLRILLGLSGELPLCLLCHDEVSSKEFIFPICYSKFVTFVRSSLSSFLLCGGWYGACCGATACVGYGMGTIGATGYVIYGCSIRYGCCCGWRVGGFYENYSIFCYPSCRHPKLRWFL